MASSYKRQRDTSIETLRNELSAVLERLQTSVDLIHEYVRSPLSERKFDIKHLSANLRSSKNQMMAVSEALSKMLGTQGSGEISAAVDEMIAAYNVAKTAALRSATDDQFRISFSTIPWQADANEAQSPKALVDDGGHRSGCIEVRHDRRAASEPPERAPAASVQNNLNPGRVKPKKKIADYYQVHHSDPDQNKFNGSLSSWLRDSQYAADPRSFGDFEAAPSVAVVAGDKSPACQRPTEISKNDPTAGFEAFAKLVLKSDIHGRAPASIPFDGVAAEFRSFKYKFKARTDGFGLSPLEEIAALESNTTGDPQRLIRTYSAAYVERPGEGLKHIWHTLEQRYGGESKVAASVRAQLRKLPQLDPTSGTIELERFLDVCLSACANVEVIPQLGELNFAEGMREVREKLSEPLQRKWQKFGNKFQKTHGCHPSFKVFCDFLSESVDELTNEDFSVCVRVSRPKPSTSVSKERIASKPPPKVAFSTSTSADIACKDSPSAINRRFNCLVHGFGSHRTSFCDKFAALPVNARKALVLEAYACFRCLNRHNGGVKGCKSRIQCETCHSEGHHALLHMDDQAASAMSSQTGVAKTSYPDGEQTEPRERHTLDCEAGASASSYAISGPSFKLCGKAFLVELTAPEHSPRSVTTYAVLDDCSDSTFVDPRVLEVLDVPTEKICYGLTTIDRQHCIKDGFRATGLVVRGVREGKTFALPPALTSDLLPNCHCLVASPEDVLQYTHLHEFSGLFPDVLENGFTGVLIGRDATDLMTVQTLGACPPYIQKTNIGVCLIGAPIPAGHHGDVNSFHTATDVDSCLRFRASVLPPSASNARLADVFVPTGYDEEPAPSREDKRFLEFLEENVSHDEYGHLCFPLPFRSTPNLPSNKQAVRRRMENTTRSLKTRPDDLIEAVAFFSAALGDNHIVPLPGEDPLANGIGKEEWFLPIFCVRHPKKRKLRIVMDSAASYKGVSLNSALFTGPDTNNSLTSVLNRFREDSVASIADVRQMFFQFSVSKDHQRFLKLFWFSGNNPDNELAVFQARVHVFGNCCSPGIAIFGLRYACRSDREILDVVTRTFYVDDMMLSTPSSNRSIDLLQRTIELLRAKGIELHKIVSNSKQVLDAFPHTAVTPQLLDIELNDAPIQRGLGIAWNLATDSLAIRSEQLKIVLTRRGILSTIHSIFDPLGFISPVLIAGRLMMRQIMADSSENGWDDPLPGEISADWIAWVRSLSAIGHLEIPRCTSGAPSSHIEDRALHVFSDASSVAIGAVAYLRTVDLNGTVHVGFVCSSSRLAPKLATSIPRLELCACVEATRMAQRILSDLVFTPYGVSFYTDSMVAIGYLRNSTRRFSVYISNRVSACLQMFSPEQWHFVPTSTNPADFASRSMSVEDLRRSCWFSGPPFLHESQLTDFGSPEEPVFSDLPELKKCEPDTSSASVMQTTVNMPALLDRSITLKSTGSIDGNKGLFDILYKRTNRWVRIVNITHRMLRLCRKWLQTARQSISQKPAQAHQPASITRHHAVLALVRDAQHSAATTTQSPQLLHLSPFLDRDSDVVRVGGRLSNSTMLPFYLKHPMLLPHSHPIALTVLLHYHERIKHQGARMTTGELFSNGFLLTKTGQVVKQAIKSCILCKRFRGSAAVPLMAPLPCDRVEKCPVFTYVSCDAFGPYLINGGPTTRRTVKSKVWVMIFVCQTSRAVHLEMMDHMSTSSFLMSFRSFCALRGNVKQMRSDRGGNFIGAVNEDVGLNIADAVGTIERSGVTWIFNPPYASHMGGSWERKIRSVRSVLNNALALMGNRLLDATEFRTYLNEASSVVNNTPLTQFSSSTDSDPIPLTPAMLLFAKDGESCNPPPLESFSPLDLLAYGRKRWRRCQALVDSFWDRWHKEYLTTLLSRQKWLLPSRPFAVGDVVLVVEKCAKRNDWKIARVEQTHPSSDGHVRKVSLRFGTSTRLLDRPASSLILLIGGV